MHSYPNTSNPGTDLSENHSRVFPWADSSPRPLALEPGARRFCVAPMLDRTDRFCRYFFRQISQYAYLYTEMVTSGAILHGDQQRHLYFNEAEHPLALQLGGSDPIDLARCARIAEKRAYAEVNLNCGCPSNRVQAGRFGACLMREPQSVASAIKAMNDAVSIPVTIKCRIGVDDSEHYGFLRDFVGANNEAGCTTFIVHARKAWLNGLSPKQNREIPPLDYPVVYRLKKDFPKLEIIINGGITTLSAAQGHLQYVDGVMLGREVCQNPWLLAEVDQAFYSQTNSSKMKQPPEQASKTRDTVVRAMLDYAELELQQGARLQQIIRPMLNLYRAQPNARRFRRYLSENAGKTGAGIDVLEKALEHLLADAS